MLRFDGTLGGFCGHMAVLVDESGKYADVLGRTVAIEWIEEPWIPTGQGWSTVCSRWKWKTPLGKVTR